MKPLRKIYRRYIKLYHLKPRRFWLEITAITLAIILIITTALLHPTTKLTTQPTPRTTPKPKHIPTPTKLNKTPTAPRTETGKHHYTLKIKAIDVNSTQEIKVPVNVDFLNGTVRTYETPTELKLPKNTTIVIVPIKQMLSNRYINVTYDHGGAVYRLKYVYTGKDIKLTIINNTEIELKYVERSWGIGLVIEPARLLEKYASEGVTTYTKELIEVFLYSLGGFHGNCCVAVTYGNLTLVSGRQVMNISKQALVVDLRRRAVLHWHIVFNKPVGTEVNLKITAYSISEPKIRTWYNYKIKVRELNLEEIAKKVAQYYENVYLKAPEYRLINVSWIIGDNKIVQVIEWKRTTHIEVVAPLKVKLIPANWHGSTCTVLARFKLEKPLYKGGVVVKVTIHDATRTFWVQVTLRWGIGRIEGKVYSLGYFQHVQDKNYEVKPEDSSKPKVVVVEYSWDHGYRVLKTENCILDVTSSGGDLGIVYPYAKYIDVEVALCNASKDAYVIVEILKVWGSVEYE